MGNLRFGVLAIGGLLTASLLAGCTSGPSQADTYACQDWGIAYSNNQYAETLGSAELAGKLYRIMSEDFYKAADQASSESLKAVLEEAGAVSQELSIWIQSTDPAVELPDLDADKRVYRKCLELKIPVQLDMPNPPGWYEGN